MINLTHIRILAFLAILLLSCTHGWSQTSVSVGGETLMQHGYNSAGELKNPGSEERDSVTTGSTSKYYVVPDATINDTYTGVLAGTLKTNFTWSAVNTSGSAGISAQSSVNPAYSNYKQVTWTGTGTLDLNIQENTAAGCSGDPKIVPVTVIAAPTIGFTTNNEVDGVCLTGTDGSLNYKLDKNFAMTFSSSIGGSKQDIIVKINIKGVNLISSHDLELNLTRTGSTSGTFSVETAFEFDYYDTYEITLISVSDRISRKNGLWNAATGKFTFNVYPVPQTGAVQHISNM